MAAALVSAAIPNVNPGPAVSAETLDAPQVSPSAEQTVHISVLTYNVHGLPWPLTGGRGAALRAIGRELAAQRDVGLQPDVVLIQEGFRDEIADLVKLSGYRFWAQGPSRPDRAPKPPPGGRSYPSVRYPLAGEGWGKFTGSGLHILSDLPIVAVQSEPYRACAGLDCLANKGVMLARLVLPNGAGEVDVVNTHMNAKKASRTPPGRALRAHNRQTEQLAAFVQREHAPDIPLLVGGDFNVKGAPTRYDYEAQARPYMVVSEFCDALDARCEGQAPAAAQKPWLRSQDLQAFRHGKPVGVRPVRVATVFDATQGRQALSDHAGYLVRYQLNWSPTDLAPEPAPPAVEVKPTLGTWGVKVSWRR
ncbi:endonuclease/exonuclease/phosphatase family protein [Phenylobacterium sp. LjRoot225]|uniref:endonuclease/exonuclease/phosphatase family protein n=1 Tax=Phenylobacterium sp. LjRoot225 TaxID=3342285 RepID=UPI003ECD7D5C